MVTLTLVICSGALSVGACIGEMILSCCDAQKAKKRTNPHFSRRGREVEVKTTLSEEVKNDVSKDYNSVCLTSAMIINVALAVAEAVLGLLTGPLGDHSENFEQYDKISFVLAFVSVPFPIIIAICAKKIVVVRWIMLICYIFG